MSPSRVRDLFTETDLDAIRDATREAESRTAGEIVTVIVGRCGEYEIAIFKTMLLGVFVGLAVALLALVNRDGWGEDVHLWTTVGAMVGAAAGGALMKWFPALRLIGAGEELVDRRTLARARQAFLEEQVHETRDRTGVLLFIAVFERRVHVLADQGIHARVDPSAWEVIAGRLAEGLGGGKHAEPVVEAIHACGKLLEASGVERRPDDVDEHDDSPRLHDE